MPITVHGTGTAFVSSTTVTAVDLIPPSGVPSGAFLLAGISVNASVPALTPPAGEGWASVLPADGTGVAQYAPVSGLSQRLYWKISDGSEPSPHAFALATAQQVSGIIVAYLGVDTTSPFDVTWQGLAGDADLFIEFPAITPLTAGAWLVKYGSANLTSTNPTDITGPPGYTARGVALHRRPTYFADKAWTSGIEVADEATMTSAVTGGSQGISLVLKPGAGAADTTPPAAPTGLTVTLTTAGD